MAHSNHLYDSLKMFTILILLSYSCTFLAVLGSPRPGGNPLQEPRAARNLYLEPGKSRRGSSDDELKRMYDANYNATMAGQRLPGGMCPEGGAPGPAGLCRKSGLDMKELTISLIKQDILRKLRMDENRLPNITGKDFPIPPSYLSEFMDEMQGDAPRDDYYDDEHAFTEKIIAFSKFQQAKMSPNEMRGVHYFTFSDKLSNMRIESAYLYVHVKQIGHHNGHHLDKTPFTVRVSEVLSPSADFYPTLVDYGYYKPMYRPSSSDLPQARHARSRWVQLDVSSALNKWISDMPSSSSSPKRFGLVLEIYDSYGRPTQDISILSSSNEMDVNSNPFVEIHVTEKKKSRPTRNIGMTCDENSKETRCCRYPLTVDFDEFGWDWVIAPKKYDANYCSGECPYAFLQKYPHNHIIQQAIPSNVGGPCCSSRKMSSISMLYFNADANIVYSVLPGMVVDKCGCS